MRSIDASQLKLALLPSRKTAVRVLVAGPKDPFGLDQETYPLFDLTDLCGIDWVKSWEVNQDPQNQIATATVQIFRSAFGVSLSPFVPASKAQGLAAQQLGISRITHCEQALVWVGRRIQIETQLCPDLAEADPAGQWDCIFDGHIDEPDFGAPANIITLPCRDGGGLLQDYYVSQAQPPTLAVAETDGNWFLDLAWPVLLTDLLAALVTHTIVADYTAAPASISGFAVPLFVLDDPAIALNQVDPSGNAQPLVPRQALLQTLQDLCVQYGFDCRYWWNQTAGEFQLTVRHPNRYFNGPSSVAVRGLDGISLELALTPAHFTLQGAKASLAQVRNKCRVPYTNIDTGDGGSATFSDWEEDADSEHRYGVRAYETTADATGNIQSDDQATAAANQILNDLSRPWFSPALDAIYLPFVELNDAIQLAPYANPDGDDVWTDPIWVSVQSIHHSGDNKGNAKTGLTTRQVFVFSGS